MFIFLVSTFVFSRIHAQNVLDRSAFSIPKGKVYSRVSLKNPEQLQLKSTGIGNVWDCSMLTFEDLDNKFVFDEYADIKPVFSGNTYTLTSIEGGSSSKGYELYSMTDGFVLLRGYGMIDEFGSRTFEEYERPYPILRFPWSLGEGYFLDHPFRTSTKTLKAVGSLILPNGNAIPAHTIIEEYEDRDTYVFEHLWFADSLPYPLMQITERFNTIDSTLISLTGELLLKEFTSKVNENKNTKELSIVYSGSSIIIPFKHTLIGIYDLTGMKHSFTMLNEHEYSIQELTSGSLFIVYKNDIGNIHTHILPNLQ